MIFSFILNLLNLLFFKAFSKYKLSDLSYLYFVVAFIFSFVSLLLVLLVFFVLLKLIELLKIINTFINLILFSFRNWILSHFFSFFLDFLFFIHRIRFVFFSGTSYYDPLTKIFLDKFSILKGEFLMDFYNFSNKFIFENDFNVPISIFSQTPVVEPGRNFYLVKTYFNLQSEMIQVQNKSRSFFYFSFKKNSLQPCRNLLMRNIITSSTFSLSLNFVNKMFLLILVFLFNFCSLDFFVFLNRVNLILLHNKNFSFFNLFFCKYFTFLRSIFLSLLINLEHDSFLNYLYVTLYRLSLKNFYTKNDWNNIFNTYNLNFTESFSFTGFSKTDLFSFFKITLFYFILYFNYMVFLIVSIFGFAIKIFFYMLLYLSSFFNIYINIHSFFINFFNIFSFFYFSFFSKIFYFFQNLFFFPFLKYILKLNNIFFKILKNFSYFSYLIFLVYTFFSLFFFYFQFFFSILIFFFNKIFIFIYLIFNNIFSLKPIDYFYFSHFSTHKKFFSNLVVLLNYLKFNSFFLFENSQFFSNRNTFILLFEYMKLNYYCHFYLSNKHSSFSNYKFSKLYKVLVFFRLFRLSFFSFIILFRIPLNVLLNYKAYLVSGELIFLNKYIFNISNSSIFFLDYLMDLFFFYLFYPFFFFLNGLSMLSLNRLLLVFIAPLFELIFFFKSLLWLFSSLFYNIFYYFQFFVFVIVFCYFCYFFCYFLLFSVLILCICFLFFFVFYFLYRLFFKLFSYCFFNKYFMFLFLFFRLNVYYYYYYFNLIYFLKVRNFGFLEILGIFFLIRNDLKKYESLHTSLAYMNFSSLNTDLLINNFLNQFINKSIIQNGYDNLFSSTPFFDFKKFKNIFSKQYVSLNKFKQNNFRNKFLKVQIRNDLFPEFEYHKYLRSRHSRNLHVFRLRKAIAPHDLYFDPILDKLDYFHSNSVSNIFLNFDFLKFFYADDLMFMKDFTFFRNIFSRKNLSFFYDNLDSMSNFRIMYNKISPIFRYFYLKREKMKYIFSMYTFGNINYFSFSILFNWLLTYRILRTTKNLFYSLNNSFLIFQNRTFPKFSLTSLSIIFDQIILFFNLFLNLFVCLFVFVFYFYFFPFSWFFFIFFLLKFLFLLKLISKSIFYVKYTEKRPQSFSFSYMFFSFFQLVSFHKFFFKKFTFSFRYFFYLFIFILCSSLFILYLCCFDLTIFSFFFFEFNYFSEFRENILILYFLPLNQNQLLVMVHIYFSDFCFFLFVFFFLLFIFRFTFFSKNKFNVVSRISNFDNFVLIKFFLFLLKIDTKFKLLHLLAFFRQNKISPYILLNELDFLIRLKKVENEKIKTLLKKER